MLSRIIFYCFSLLFFLVPLTWSPLNFELFEYSKMILVYLLTIIIVGAWILKSINQKKLVITRTPLDIPLLLFLGANILSTIFSIDRHISIYGYYSRSNGGLLSIISYLLLYFALVSNLEKVQVIKVLKIGLLSGFIVSLWGIFEHFGVSPSCVILQGQFNASCWVQDVQARVFATLGQPNWMAAYLAMLIFPALYFLLNTKDKKDIRIFSLATIAYYLGLTFTYSRGGFAGFLAGLLTFAGFLFFKPRKLPRLLLVIIGTFLLANIVFGSALTRIKIADLLPKAPAPPVSQAPSAITQLENGGTESWQIRLIVWQGGLEIFKHYPLLGSGVETFAYSYDRYRPIAHNLTSEWDFLYNKAHNEFVNYLATTGILGFSTYLFLIGTFIYWALRQKSMFVTAILASYVSFLVQNLVGFSVVIIALFFYLFPAIAFIVEGQKKSLTINIPKVFQFKVSKFILILGFGYLLFIVSQMWRADTIFATGEKASDNNNPVKAYSYLTSAAGLKMEPFYVSELSVTAAELALQNSSDNATLSAQLKKQAEETSNFVLKNNPNNVSYWKSAIQTYYYLSLFDSSYNDKLLETFDNTINLSPTDPKLYYNKAVELGTLDRNDEAIENLKKATSLKPNYREAYLALGLFYYDQKKFTEAVAEIHKVLQLVPGDAEALQQLNDWGKQGIATESANP